MLKVLFEGFLKKKSFILFGLISEKISSYLRELNNNNKINTSSKKLVLSYNLNINPSMKLSSRENISNRTVEELVPKDNPIKINTNELIENDLKERLDKISNENLILKNEILKLKSQNEISISKDMEINRFRPNMVKFT